MNRVWIYRRVSALIISLVLLIPGLLVITGCQEVFTYSLFEGMQRDFSSLSREQKISYAEDVLASGDAKAMAEIYDEIAAMAANDPELYLLAADLAMGASGITDVIGDFMSDPDAFDYTTDLASIDLAMLSNVADNVLAAETAGLSGISEEHYVAAAGAEILQWLELGNSLPVDSAAWDAVSADPLGDNLEKAKYFIVQAGQNPAEFDDIFG